MTYKNFFPVLLLLAGCGADTKTPASTAPAEEDKAESAYIWATNVGGEAYTGIDGVEYEAESSVTGGTVGAMEVVKGSQDPMLYQSFREGDIRVDKELPNGVYDVTLLFAEHVEDAGGGTRVFDVIVNGEKRIPELDVMAWRDGKTISGLTVATPAVNVTDGKLEIRFEATAGQPILSAVVVREQAPRSDEWELVWSDEFDYDGVPDPAKWSYNIWKPGKVNLEEQYYTDREKNVRVEDGMLVIEAHLEDYEGAKYTSGRIHTEGKADFMYGRFDIRAKVPRGQGTWPAVWMLPSDAFKYATTCEAGADWQGSSTCDAWPNSGEIDILEHVGYQMGHVHGTVHNRAYYWVNWEQRKGRLLDFDVDTEFHVYSVEWSEDRIDMFVDDVLYFTYMNEGTGWEAWPYDHPYNLIINIAMGGAWGSAGGPTDDSALPQKLFVDWVRVYQMPDSGSVANIAAN
ncbi:MAG: family 16 glycosylhydrolase [Woeseiaceae bacterium]|nr:family 16 glycosylhydrolase [Woeseiaceae bacterium]